MKITSPNLLLAALLFPAPLFGAELQRANVPAEARWVGHFDLQAFQRTTLWQRLSQNAEFQADAMEGFSELESELGINPFRDVFSATIYGLGADEEEAVLVLETTTAIDHAIERFSKEGGYHRTSRQGLDIHTWSDEGFVHVVSRPDGRRLVLVASDVENLVEGVRVVQGQAQSLAGSGSARLSAVPRRESFAFFAAIDGIPGLHEIDPASQVANLATGLVLDVGEAGGELFVNASVQTADVDSALNLMKVGDGLVALAQLAMMSEDVPDELSSLISALHLEVRGNAVSVEFRYAVDQLLELIEVLDQLDEGETESF